MYFFIILFFLFSLPNITLHSMDMELKNTELDNNAFLYEFFIRKIMENEEKFNYIDVSIDLGLTKGDSFVTLCSNDGNVVAMHQSQSKKLKLYKFDAQKKSYKLIISEDHIAHVALSANGKAFACSSDNSVIKIYILDKQKLEHMSINANLKQNKTVKKIMLDAQGSFCIIATGVNDTQQGKKKKNIDIENNGLIDLFIWKLGDKPIQQNTQDLKGLSFFDTNQMNNVLVYFKDHTFFIKKIDDENKLLTMSETNGYLSFSQTALSQSKNNKIGSQGLILNTDGTIALQIKKIKEIEYTIGYLNTLTKAWHNVYDHKTKDNFNTVKIELGASLDTIEWLSPKKLSFKYKESSNPLATFVISEYSKTELLVTINNVASVHIPVDNFFENIMYSVNEKDDFQFIFNGSQGFTKSETIPGQFLNFGHNFKGLALVQKANKYALRRYEFLDQASIDTLNQLATINTQQMVLLNTLSRNTKSRKSMSSEEKKLVDTLPDSVKILVNKFLLTENDVKQISNEPLQPSNLPAVGGSVNPVIAHYLRNRHKATYSRNKQNSRRPESTHTGDHLSGAPRVPIIPDQLLYTKEANNNDIEQISLPEEQNINLTSPKPLQAKPKNRILLSIWSAISSLRNYMRSLFG